MNKLNIFLSYTTREEEIEHIQPLLRIYCRDLWEWAKSKGIEIYYDDFTMEKRQYSETELKQILKEAVGECHMMTAFLSASYVESKWCLFEYLQAKNQKKPIHGVVWKLFELGLPPIPELLEELMPEAETDITYLRENPASEELGRAAKECVENSIELIRSYYRV